MELKWLDDFLALAEAGSFSKTAVQRHITQPALSRRIRALEDWVGSPLIDRSVHPTQLTPAGRKFRKVAAATAAELRGVRDDLRTEAEADRTLIRFAALHTLALTYFPRWIRALSPEAGMIRSQLIAENLPDCQELLSSGGCDLLLCYAHPSIPVLRDDARFASLPLSVERFVPVTRPEDDRGLHLLPGTPAQRASYLGYPSDTLLGRLVQLVLSSGRQAHLDLRYENSMAEALKSMALEGAGLAWLPFSLAKEDLEQGRLRLAGGAEWQIGMEIRLYRRTERASRSVEALWAEVAERSRKRDPASLPPARVTAF